MAEFTVPLASIWLTWQVTTIKWTFYGTNLYRKLVITFSTDRTIVRIKFLFLLGTALYVLESAVEIFFLIPASSSSRVSVKLLRYPCKIFVSVASFSCHFVRVYTHGRVLNGYHINWGLFGTRWSLLYAFWRLEILSRHFLPHENQLADKIFSCCLHSGLPCLPAAGNTFEQKIFKEMLNETVFVHQTD